MATLTVKRIVCLASSRMPARTPGGRCIAGRELQADGRPGPWVRPVNGRDNAGLTPSESRYENGSTPRLLDVMDVPVLNAHPKSHQRENWLLDPNRRWAKVGSASLDDLPNWVDEFDPLCTNQSSSSKGRNDRVHTSYANSINSSLCLIKVNLKVWVFDNYNRRTVQGRFRHGGTDYWLRVTDPNYEQKYNRRPDGCYDLGERFVTISLAGAYTDEYCYKLIAAIIKP